MHGNMRSCSLQHFEQLDTAAFEIENKRRFLHKGVTAKLYAMSDAVRISNKL